MLSFDYAQLRPSLFFFSLKRDNVIVVSRSPFRFTYAVLRLRACKCLTTLSKKIGSKISIHSSKNTFFFTTDCLFHRLGHQPSNVATTFAALEEVLAPVAVFIVAAIIVL